jgi:hypothetical protein
MTRVRTAIAALLLALTAVAAGQQAEPQISVSDAWMSEAPPGTQVAAAYMEIRNGTGRPIALVGANAPRFERIEMHESELRNGMASMRRLDRIDIPAGGRVTLAPGGKHLMLFRKPPLPRDGDIIFMALQFSDGSLIGANVQVRGSGGGSAAPAR